MKKGRIGEGRDGGDGEGRNEKGIYAKGNLATGALRHPPPPLGGVLFYL